MNNWELVFTPLMVTVEKPNGYIKTLKTVNFIPQSAKSHEERYTMRIILRKMQLSVKLKGGLGNCD